MRVTITFCTLMLLATWAGCGTTKWSDTARTATEQLLISDSIDRAVSRLDLRALAGKRVYVDETPIKQVTDCAYLASAIRQQVLASGAILKEKKEEAEYILEVRGAVGTDRNDILFGIPATSLPAVTGATYPSTIPEIAFAKKTDQRGVAKISLFAYNRETGRPVWQSGAAPVESQTKALWVLGAGPFQRGTIYHGTTFAGDRVHIPLIDPMLPGEGTHSTVSVADEAFFVEPKEPPKATKPAVAGQSGTEGKDKTAASSSGDKKPSDSKAADAKTTDSKTADVKTAEAKTAGSQPDSKAEPAGLTVPQAGATTPDRRAERIPDVPPTASSGASGPPAGDSRPSSLWPPSWGASPVGADMPAQP